MNYKNIVFYQPNFTKKYGKNLNITDYLYTIKSKNGKKEFVKYTSTKINGLSNVVNIANKYGFSVYADLSNMIEIRKIHVTYYSDVVCPIRLNDKTLYSNEDSNHIAYFIPKDSIPDDKYTDNLIEKSYEDIKAQENHFKDLQRDLDAQKQATTNLQKRVEDKCNWVQKKYNG